jgi:hypothetical protein
VQRVAHGQVAVNGDGHHGPHTGRLGHQRERVGGQGGAPEEMAHGAPVALKELEKGGEVQGQIQANLL